MNKISKADPIKFSVFPTEINDLLLSRPGIAVPVVLSYIEVPMSLSMILETRLKYRFSNVRRSSLVRSLGSSSGAAVSFENA